MTATNHVLTGAVIGAAVQQPVLAVPLALASHFVCDALPHFGPNANMSLKSRKYTLYLLSDCTLAAALLLLLVLGQPQYWWLMVACGIVAASPDLMWLPGYLRELRGQARFEPRKSKNWLMRFHSVIQWSQTPPGMALEVVWFVGAGWLLLNLL